MFLFKRFFSFFVSFCFTATFAAVPITPIQRGVLAHTTQSPTTSLAQPSEIDDTGIVIRPITNPVKGDSGQDGGSSGSGIGINPPTPPGTTPKPPPPTNNYPAPNPYVPIPINQPLMGGLSCPLTDTRMTSDVLTSIETLQRAIQGTPDCQSNLPSLTSMTENLRNSTKSMTEIYENPELLLDSVTKGDFENNVRNMVGSLDQLTRSLDQNALLNPRCQSQLKSNGGFLVALSDVVTGVAPFAVFAAGTAVKSAIPWVGGIIGVATLVKVLASMASEKSLQIERYDVRQTVLQQVCEYTKIQRRMNFLKKIYSGQIEEATIEIQFQKKFIETMNTDPELDPLIAQRNKSLEKFLPLKKQLKKDYVAAKQLNDLLLRSQADGTPVCSMASELLNKMRDPVTYPGSAVLNAKRVNATTPVLDNPRGRYLFATEENLRQAIGQFREYKNFSQMEECSKFIISYSKNMREILQNTREQIAFRELSIDKSLSENPKYKKWLARFSKMQKEQDAYEKVLSFVREMNERECIPCRSEAEVGSDQLKAGLFGRKSHLPFADSWAENPFIGFFAEPLSPSAKWLVFFSDQLNYKSNLFLLQMKELRKAAYSITRSGTGNFTLIHPETKKRRQMTSGERTRQEIFDRGLSRDLSILDLKWVPEGSARQKYFCHSLDQAFQNWSGSLYHLNNLRLFCDTVKEFLDQEVQRTVQNFCLGQKNPDGKGSRTLVEEKEKMMKQVSFKQDALLVFQKMKELKCPMPDPLDSDH